MNFLQASSLSFRRVSSVLHRSLASAAAVVHDTIPQTPRPSAQFRPGPKLTRITWESQLTPRRDVYQLPVNNEERIRLNNQHVLLKMLIGGNYTTPIREHLKSDAGHKKTILDLGCGTGAWALDMASEFPRCSVIGADVAPMVGPTAPNIRIDVCDANKGLQIYKTRQFDLVNGRLIAMGISNYNALIDEISRVLKKDGYLQLQEWDFFAVDAQKRLVGIDRWFGRWCAALRHALTTRSASIAAAESLDKMVNNQGTFQIVQARDVWMPIGPCVSPDTPEGQHLNLVGEFMRENVKAFIKGGKSLILGNGMSLDDYQVLERNATSEVQDANIPMYLRLNCVTARKI